MIKKQNIFKIIGFAFFMLVFPAPLPARQLLFKTRIKLWEGSRKRKATASNGWARQIIH